MRNWSLQAKVVGILSIFVVSNVLVLGLGLRKLYEADQTTDMIVDSLSQRLEHVHSLAFRQTVMAVALRDGLLESEPEEVRAALKKMTASRAEHEAEIKAFSKMASEEGKALIASYQTQFAAWFDSAEDVLNFGMEKNQAEGLVHLKTKTAPLRKEMADKLESIVKLNQAKMQEGKAHAQEEYESAFSEMLAISAIALLIGSIMAAMILRKVNKSISNVIESLQSNSEQVASASAQIASSSEELSQASTEQAASLEETAAALEQISAMIAKSSENAETTASKSAESEAKAEEGRQAVEQMLRSMNDISQSNEAIMTQINQSNQQMSDIVRVIQEIGTKTKVINEIVFQTKLLSFNASVEAARAGDHGKGFAVVADEVGNLAQMSGNAAMEISEMLNNSINKVEQIVSNTKSKVESLTESGRQKVESGVVVARQCSVVLKDIVSNISRVAVLAREISQGSLEQAQGVGEINKAMTQLDSVTQQNAATSEEAASAAEELSAQAEGLKDAVVELVRTIQGGNDIAPAQAPVQTPTPAKRESPRDAKVLRIKPASKPARPTTVAMKAASGDSRVPSRDDEGFPDV